MKTKHYDANLIKDIKRKVDEVYFTTNNIVYCHVENNRTDEYTGYEHCVWFVRHNFNWYMDRRLGLILIGNEKVHRISQFFDYKAVLVDILGEE